MMAIWGWRRKVREQAAQVSDDLECARSERQRLREWVIQKIAERERRLRALEEQERLLNQRWRQLRDSR